MRNLIAHEYFGIRIETIWETAKNIVPELKRAKIQAKDLFNESFYIDMVNRWIREYETIDKYNLINDKMNLYPLCN